MPLDEMTIILGYLNHDSIKIPLNMIILNTKAYIFQCAKSQKNPNIFALQSQIKHSYIAQKFIADINGQELLFLKKWQKWTPLFENI